MTVAVVIIIIIIILILIWLVYNLVWGTPPTINLAVARISLRMALADPERLTSLGLIDNTLLDFHSSHLTDASPRHMANLRRLDRTGLALIRRYAVSKLTGQDKLTYQLMRWYFEQNLRGHPFTYHWIENSVFMGPYPVNHVFGVQVNLIHFLSKDHKINGRRSARRYIARLKKVDWKFTGLVESLEARSAAGVIPPRFVVEKSLAQIDKFLLKPTDENPLYLSFMERASETGRINNNVLEGLEEDVKQAIEISVIPAYQELQVYLQDLMTESSDEDGVWRLPDGDAYYAFLLRNHTTTEMTPEAIHQLGLAEVERLTEDIRVILRGLGLPTEEPGRQLKALMEDPQYHYNIENPRKAILDDYEEILDEVNRRMPECFNDGELDNVVVKRLPAYKEPDSPIAYAQPPSLDGNQPGTLWINLRHPENIYTWGMRTLAYHEGIPGHVYQMAQAQRIIGLPIFRRSFFFNAYIEGWAMYAEYLGWALNLLDEMSNLGRLQALLWRAARLVVDTGIHAKKWDRKRAINYMVETTGLPERDMVTEVERYIVMPGQACAYYIGYLKFLALRQKAEMMLGAGFNQKDFHDWVINNGSLHLTMLEEVVNTYLDRAAGFTTSD